MPQSLYTDEIQQFIRTRDWPKGLIIDVYDDAIETPAGLIPILRLVLYRDNFIQFEKEVQEKIATTIAFVLEKLRKDGVPIYTGKMENVPRR